MWTISAWRAQHARQLGAGLGLAVTWLVMLAGSQIGECRVNTRTRTEQYLRHASSENSKVHIVYMGGNPEGRSPTELKDHHVNTLAYVRSRHGQTDEFGAGKLHHSYCRTLNGFSASLSPDEVDTMSGMPGVVSVFPSRIRTVSTTRSWQFMGLDASSSNSLWSADHSGRNVIIGLLDTGIWPESRSFHEQSMPAVPNRWKGSCKAGDANFNASTCNKKVIGGAFYPDGFEAQIGTDIPRGFRSARDQSGHGTHTSSTAAGQLVRGANLFGLAQGDARGGAPLAHLAMYKVCWASESSANEIICTDADILAAFDDAVADGVDVISVSLNQMLPAGDTPEGYVRDSLALGSLHAALKGVFVAASAGNEGRPESVTNVAPWMTTVAASTIDRRFPATLVLGNHASYEGSAINDRSLSQRPWYPLVSGADVSAWDGDNSYSTVCAEGTLEQAKVKGSIVYCKSSGPGYDSYTGPVQAGAVGMVWPNSQGDGPAEAYVYDIPTSLVNQSAESAILHYISTTKSPVATITQPTTVVNFNPAPMMATFSSRGPNKLQPEILKPDLTAPGVDILASWTPTNPPTEELGGTDTRSEEFNIVSGTSMSAPHLAGAAALIKSMHPTWSPAAIRSALMTTASAVDKHNKPIQDHTGRAVANAFSYGSGHINPVAAADPGLVYDASATDYARFLCAAYDTRTIRRMTGDTSFACPTQAPAPHNLNYPSIALPTVGWNSTRTVVRTLTNVGTAPATYTVEVQAPPGVRVSVTPRQLSFRSTGDRASFSAKVSPASGAATSRYLFGAIVWTDGRHRVRAPVVVRVHIK